MSFYSRTSHLRNKAMAAHFKTSFVDGVFLPRTEQPSSCNTIERPVGFAIVPKIEKRAGISLQPRQIGHSGWVKRNCRKEKSNIPGVSIINKTHLKTCGESMATVL